MVFLSKKRSQNGECRGQRETLPQKHKAEYIKMLDIGLWPPHAFIWATTHIYVCTHIHINVRAYTYTHEFLGLCVNTEYRAYQVDHLGYIFFVRDNKGMFFIRRQERRNRKSAGQTGGSLTNINRLLYRHPPGATQVSLETGSNQGMGAKKKFYLRRWLKVGLPSHFLPLLAGYTAQWIPKSLRDSRTTL